MVKYTRLNKRFSLIEYPASLEEMKEISLELPKTERKFYEFAFKSLEKVMKKDEPIYSFGTADAKMSKTGFMVIGKHNLYLVSMKGGLMGGADTEVIKYSDIQSVDFDVAGNPFGLAQMELGIIYLEMKAMFGTKKRTISNIPDYNLDAVFKKLKDQVETFNK